MAGLQDPIVPQASHNPFAPYISAMVATAAIADRRSKLVQALQAMEDKRNQADAKLELATLMYQSQDALRQAQIHEANAKTTEILGAAKDAINNAKGKSIWQVGVAQIAKDNPPGTKNFIHRINALRNNPDVMSYLSSQDGKVDWRETIDSQKEAAKTILDAQTGLTKSYNDQLSDAFGKKGWQRQFAEPQLEFPDQWDRVDANNKSITDPRNYGKAVKRVLKLDANGQPLAPNVDNQTYSVSLPKDRFDTLINYRAKKAEMDKQIQSGYLQPDLESAGEQIRQEATPPPSIPTLSNPADAAKLPSGTKFYDPNGILRTTP